MAITAKDIKLLWGRSGNRCAICRTVLTQDSATVSAAYTLGEQAHIVGEQDSAPRGKSPMPLDQRNSYHNLILLCPTHHSEIDKNEAGWPVERVHRTKSVHELWVTETLSEQSDKVKAATKEALTAIVDSAVADCGLNNWEVWTSYALSADQKWSQERLDAIWRFRRRVLAAIWPEGYEELRCAAETLSKYLHAAVQEFMRHSVLQGDMYIVDRYYRRSASVLDGDKDCLEFENWQDYCFRLLEDSTKAANWLSDVVRRDINPTFFASTGKFLISQGPFMDGSIHSRLLEFSGQEKAGLLASLSPANNHSG